MAKGIYNISEGNIMAATSRIIYIYIEGSDLGNSAAVQQQKHFHKGREFMAIQYTQDGSFIPELPTIDADTKVIIDGHGYPLSDNLFQRREGGIELSYQTIADELTKKMVAGDDRIQIALYGCDTGVGESRDSHSKSFAGKLFRALVEKGLKPTISANLSPSSMDTIGKLSRLISIKKSHVLSEIYYQFAREFYKDDLEVCQALERFHRFQDHRRKILDFKAQGSKVELSYNKAGNSLQPDIGYPNGHPNNELRLEALNGNSGIGVQARGKAGLQYILSEEILFAQNLKDKIEKAREELRKIFEAFESAHPDLWKNNSASENEYNLLKEFLLTEDYYIDAIAISQFIGEVWQTEKENREALMSKIEKNKVLNSIKIHSKDYRSNTEICYNPDVGYLQLGLDVVANKIANYPSPILKELFVHLEKSIQEQLAIELGKQLVCHQFDAKFVHQCIREAQDLSRDDRMVRVHNPDVIPLELRISSELAKKQQGLKYDEQFIQFIYAYSLLTPQQLVVVGESFIRAGYHERISWEAFSLLSKDQQESLVILLGQQLLNYSFSSGDQEAMDDIIEIATYLFLHAQQQKTAVSQETKGIAANSSAFFSAVSPGRGKYQQSEENQQQQQRHCTIS